MTERDRALATHQRALAYAAALRAYVSGAGEAALERAYELGREAASAGDGILEMLTLYHTTLRQFSDELPEQARQFIALSGQFLAESLSPFEMTHRGFREANASLKRLNAELEAKNQALIENAAALQRAKEAADASNKELEAFSYSVSHDLRAPLRAIDGYSQMLIEDAKQLDATGQEYLTRLRGAARRMNELVEDLLRLSRISSADFGVALADLSTIARQVGEDLKQKNPERSVELTVQDGLVAQGDARLLRVVFENLLGNAWKFTAKVEHARVEVGARQQASIPVYYVRDNGAGFDGARANKLFRPFQRLHSSADFPGTGIGLATVQRVIHRHHGRIWAESTVGAGATFCFTLFDTRFGVPTP